MKKKILIYTLIVAMASVNIYMSYKIFEFNNKLVSLQKSMDIEANLSERMSKIESNVDEYAFENIDRNISQLQNHVKLEMNRMGDLIEKVGDVKSIYGVITGFDEVSGEMILDVIPVDSNKTLQFQINKKCSAYVITENGLVLMDFSEFKKGLVEEVNKAIQLGYTFKILDGQISHIYQGWGGLE